jgi:hypothetical protein
VGVVLLALFAVDRAVAAAAAVGAAAAAQALLVRPARAAALGAATHGLALAEVLAFVVVVVGPLAGVSAPSAITSSISAVRMASAPIRMGAVVLSVGCALWALTRRREGRPDAFVAMLLCGVAVLSVVPRPAADGSPALAPLACALAIAAATFADRASGRSDLAAALALGVLATGALVLGLVVAAKGADTRESNAPCARDLTPSPVRGAPSDRAWVLTPCPGTCLAADADAAAGPIEVDLFDGRSRLPLLASALPSGRLRLPLDRRAGRLSVLRLGGAGSAGLRPWLEPCACRTRVVLSDDLRAGRAHVLHSAPEARGRSIFLHPNPPGSARAEVAFDVVPCSGACFSAGLHLGEAPEPGDGVAFTVDAMWDDAEAVLAYRPYGPHERGGRIDAPLERWAGMPIRIRIGVDPGPTPNWDWASFLDPAVAPCAQDQGAPTGSSDSPSAPR